MKNGQPDNATRKKPALYAAPTAQSETGGQRSRIVAKPSGLPVREIDLQRDIAAFLRGRGYAYNLPASRVRSYMTRGWPDFTLAVNGRAVGLEVKTDKGRTSAEQDAMHGAMRRNGWRVFVVRSLEDAEACVALVEKEGK